MVGMHDVERVVCEDETRLVISPSSLMSFNTFPAWMFPLWGFTTLNASVLMALFDV